MLFVFLVSVGGFLLDEDESLFERRDDGHELFLWRVAQLLGVFRTITWVLIAAVWPLSIVLLLGSFLVGMYSLTCRPAVVRGYRWVFLGFGKYSAPKRLSFLCGND